MRIGVPKEIKNNEFRIGLTPAGVTELAHAGHEVLVERGGGASIGFDDAAYGAAGAHIAADAAEVFAEAEMIVKVKEPQPEECRMLRPARSCSPTCTWRRTRGRPTAARLRGHGNRLRDRHRRDGGLPLLAPMSEVAGRMADTGRLPQPGEGPGRQRYAARRRPRRGAGEGAGDRWRRRRHQRGAHGHGSRRGRDDRRSLHHAPEGARHAVRGRMKTLYSTREAIERHALEADLVVGAVLIPGAAAPKLISADQVRRMKPGSVLVDVAIDQGGCFETSRPTTHEDPCYIVDGVVHYCVANMPGGGAHVDAGPDQRDPALRLALARRACAGPGGRPLSA
jgi:alanine dehydrogenase